MLTCDNAIHSVIIGGGISGLWTLHRMRQAGYQAILLENNALGNGQTIASQGIIHGGIKYALTGEISESSRQISEMPLRWQHCLQGQGEIDLSSIKVLSHHYYLCSQQKITQKITQFFAQKAMRSDNDALAVKDYPTFFQQQNFSGLLTQVHECVLDVPSLVQQLATLMMPYIFKVKNCALKKQNNTYSLLIENDANETQNLQAKHIILTAGEANANFTATNAMQKRPLQMVMLAADNLPEIYVHCVELSTNPVLTITSHQTAQGQRVWYLGGQLAEEGVQRDKQEQIALAKTLIAKQFPWFTPINATWDTLFINRAEGFNHGKRPESVMLHTQDNLIFAWPTKLTFAPLLADKILQQLPKPQAQEPFTAFNAWPKPKIAVTPWEHLC